MNPPPLAYPATGSALAADVRAGLGGTGQKTLPCKYLYDDVGTALFEAITCLPEYGLTEADARLVRGHAAAMLESKPESKPESKTPENPGAGLIVAELGSGSGRKTRPLLEAACRRQFTLYCPIEISELALRRCQFELSGIPGLRIRPRAAEYIDGLTEVARLRPPGERILVLFLGSALGNLDAAAAGALLAAVRQRLEPGDTLLVGVDLVKPEAQLRSAYDDPAGVTAAFNRNLLARINRELGADFDLARFRHRIRWDAAGRRIEMHLEAQGPQRVAIPGAALEVAFAAGETIWTESCHKYRPGELDALARQSGFHPWRQWTDPEWPFSESLLVAV